MEDATNVTIEIDSLLREFIALDESTREMMYSGALIESSVQLQMATINVHFFSGHFEKTYI